MPQYVVCVVETRNDMPAVSFVFGLFRNMFAAQEWIGEASGKVNEKLAQHLKQGDTICVMPIFPPGGKFTRMPMNRPLR